MSIEDAQTRQQWNHSITCEARYERVEHVSVQTAQLSAVPSSFSDPVGPASVCMSQNDPRGLYKHGDIGKYFLARNICGGCTANDNESICETVQTCMLRCGNDRPDSPLWDDKKGNNSAVAITVGLF